jgi:hypothetical protein
MAVTYPGDYAVPGAMWPGAAWPGQPLVPAAVVPPLHSPVRAQLVPVPKGRALSSSLLPPPLLMLVPLSQPPGVRVVFLRAGHVQSSRITAAQAPPAPSRGLVFVTFTSRWRWAAGGARNKP